jgi:acyl-coenzyme A synthetase/AMP-(fatty) acid ligase
MLNSLEWYVTYMAISKTGVTVSPFNLRFASGDLTYTADVTKCKVFILGDGLLPKVEPVQQDIDFCKHYVCVGENMAGDMVSYDDVMKSGDAGDILVDTADDDMAELMFTTGTTGARVVFEGSPWRVPRQ